MRIFRPLWLIHLLTLAGCASFAYEGPRSDHFDGERFHNLAPREDKSLWTPVPSGPGRTGRPYRRGQWPGSRVANCG